MMQVTRDVTTVLASAKTHPNIQLESKAFPELPAGTKEYIKLIEKFVVKVQSLASSLAKLMR